jgi:hypothetical protein
MGNLAQNLLDTAAEHGRRPALRMGNVHVADLDGSSWQEVLSSRAI